MLSKCDVIWMSPFEFSNATKEAGICVRFYNLIPAVLNGMSYALIPMCIAQYSILARVEYWFWSYTSFFSIWIIAINMTNPAEVFHFPTVSSLVYNFYIVSGHKPRSQIVREISLGPAPLKLNVKTSGR